MDIALLTPAADQPIADDDEFATMELPPLSVDSSEALALERRLTASHRAWLDQFYKFSENEQQDVLVGLLLRSSENQLRVADHHIRALMKRDFLAKLPHDMALYLISYLDATTLARCCQVSKTWKGLCDDSALWKILYERQYGSAIPPKMSSMQPGSPVDWKAAYAQRVMIFRNMRKGRYAMQSLEAHSQNVITFLTFDDEKIISGSDDHTLKVWDAVTGQLRYSLEGHRGGVWTAQVDGDRIVSGSTDRTLKIWNARTGECTKTLEGHTSTVRCLAGVGDIFVSGSRDNTLRLWDVSTGACLKILRGHTAAVRCVMFDGRRIVSGSYDNTVKIWDPSLEQPLLHTLVGHTQKIYSLEYDGNYVISGSLDTTIKVWDAETGALLHDMGGHSSLVGLVQIRDNILVSGNADKTLRVWDLTTGQCKHVLEGHDSAVTCVYFDNEKLISGSMDGSLRLWDMKTGAMISNIYQLENGVVWRLKHSDARLVAAIKDPAGPTARVIVMDFDELSIAQPRAAIVEPVAKKLTF